MARAEPVERRRIALPDQLAPRSERSTGSSRPTFSASDSRSAAATTRRCSPSRTTTYSSAAFTAAKLFEGSVQGVVVQTSSDVPGSSASGKRT